MRLLLLLIGGWQRCVWQIRHKRSYSTGMDSALRPEKGFVVRVSCIKYLPNPNPFKMHKCLYSSNSNHYLTINTPWPWMGANHSSILIFYMYCIHSISFPCLDQYPHIIIYLPISFLSSQWSSISVTCNIYTEVLCFLSAFWK